MANSLVRVEAVTKSFGDDRPPALDGLTTQIEAGRVTGLVGPDGAGKTTLLRLMAGLLLPDEGRLTVCGLDTQSEASDIHKAIAYMPQRFGLYEDLSVIENLELYADLRSVMGAERRKAFEGLFSFTGLAPFKTRLAGALSGGMKQKLGLACALVARPRLLLLDEPSAGVDPISRRELWHMVGELVEQGIGVIWSTAYLDEAERCGSVLLLSEGRLLYEGKPGDLTKRVAKRTFAVRDMRNDRRGVLFRALARPEVIDGVIQGRTVRLVIAEGKKPPKPAEIDAGLGATVKTVPPRLEDAFMTLLGGSPKIRSDLEGRPKRRIGQGNIVVEATGLTRRFGDFVAVDDIDFSVKRGQIFGLIGPNGAGKSTTFKMLCGLLRPSSGIAQVSGLDLAKAPSKARGRLGYMAQKFSLYGDLSVRRNLEFFAGIYGLAGEHRRKTIVSMVDAFALGPYLETESIRLPLGFKQRLAIACAVMHDPDVLFLDEPTSGVDPRTRREFWGYINAMVARGVTILVTTHFLEEAEYCDGVALIYRGQIIARGGPDDLKERIRSRRLPHPTLEDAFIALVQGDDRREAA